MTFFSVSVTQPSFVKVQNFLIAHSRISWHISSGEIIKVRCTYEIMLYLFESLFKINAVLDCIRYFKNCCFPIECVAVV